MVACFFVMLGSLSTHRQAQRVATVSCFCKAFSGVFSLLASGLYLWEKEGKEKAALLTAER